MSKKSVKLPTVPRVSSDLAKALRKMEGSWTAYVCDGKLFTKEEEARSLARRLSKVRGEGFTNVWTIKVPIALPRKYDSAYGWPHDFHVDEQKPPITVYLVDGKPFESLRDATKAAQEMANTANQWKQIGVAKVAVSSIEFVEATPPEKKAEPLAVTDAA